MNLAINLAQVLYAWTRVDRMYSRARMVQSLHCNPSANFWIAL